jgi:hypothetical protein
MTRRFVITAILTVVIFLLITLFWFPYMATDIPSRYGVPLVFHESGCYMPRPHANQECVNSWNIAWLIVDLIATATLSYGIAWLLTLKATPKNKTSLA